MLDNRDISINLKAQVSPVAQDHAMSATAKTCDVTLVTN